MGRPPLNTASLRTALGVYLLAALLGGCGAVDNRPAEWGYISPALFQPNCATTSCHSPAAAVSGLDFSTPDNGFESLTELRLSVIAAPDAGPGPVPNCTSKIAPDGMLTCYLRPLVTPFDPEGSRVVNMLRARDAPRMPPDRPLPEDDIRLVERWILNGACRFGATCPSDASALDGSDRSRLPTDGATDRMAGN